MTNTIKQVANNVIAAYLKGNQQYLGSITANQV
jgi:hypothetical protein